MLLYALIHPGSRKRELGTAVNGHLQGCRDVVRVIGMMSFIVLVLTVGVMSFIVLVLTVKSLF